MQEWMSEVREGHVEATSMWHLLDGSAVWNRCDVLESNPTDDTYLIQWHSNAKSKWVSRLNLCFAPFETSEKLMVRRLLEVVRYLQRMQREPHGSESMLQILNRHRPVCQGPSLTDPPLTPSRPF